jgi:hypothetical protein
MPPATPLHADLPQRIVVPPAATPGGLDRDGLRGRTAESTGAGVAIGGMRGGGPLCLQCVSRPSGTSTESTVAAATPGVERMFEEPASGVPSRDLGTFQPI